MEIDMLLIWINTQNIFPVLKQNSPSSSCPEENQFSGHPDFTELI